MASENAKDPICAIFHNLYLRCINCDIRHKLAWNTKRELKREKPNVMPTLLSMLIEVIYDYHNIHIIMTHANYTIDDY